MKGSDQRAEEEVLRLCVAEEMQLRQARLLWRLRFMMALIVLTMIGAATVPRPWSTVGFALLLAEIAVYGGIAVHGVEMRARLTKRANRSWHRTLMLLHYLPMRRRLL